jgi:hypothetical protein
MKLESLASLLGKEATELTTTLNVDIGQEVDENQVSKLLSEHINLIKITSLSEGKKQGEGKAKREVLTDVEKRLKSEFEVDGDNFDALLTGLKSKVGKVEIKTDEKVLQELNAWKQKAATAQSELDKFKSDFERQQVISQVKTKLNPILEKFEFATEKVKEIAISNLLQDKDFLISGETTFIVENGNPIGALNDLAEKHFSDFGKVKTNTTIPPNRQFTPGPPNSENHIAELNKKLMFAKTLDEKRKILEELNKLIKN